MKTLLLNLWAWVLLHPAEVVAAVLPVLVALATVVNARSKGAPASWFARFVDALAVRTRQDAANAGWSWPLVGRSIFNAALDASAPRETQAPPPPSEPGFAERGVLAVVAGVALLALGITLLTGCAGGQTPRLSPIAPRVLVRPEYGTCVETGGKIEIPQAGTIAMLTSACFASMDASASAPDASEPEPAVIPDKSDAGASE